MRLVLSGCQLLNPVPWTNTFLSSCYCQPRILHKYASSTLFLAAWFLIYLLCLSTTSLITWPLSPNLDPLINHCCFHLFSGCCQFLDPLVNHCCFLPSAGIPCHLCYCCCWFLDPPVSHSYQTTKLSRLGSGTHATPDPHPLVAPQWHLGWNHKGSPPINSASYQVCDKTSAIKY